MKYPFKVFKTQVEGHIFWVAESQILKGCVGQGDTSENALTELEENENEWLKMAEKYGIEIPPVPVEPLNSFSGKFTIRVSPHVHEEASKIAKNQNISLNQYVNDAIVAQNSRYTTLEYIAPEIKSTISTIKALLDTYTTISRGKNHTTIGKLSSTEYTINYSNNLQKTQAGA